MASRRSRSRKIEYLERPGAALSEHEQRRLVVELRECAATCFEDLPDYQCLQDGAHGLGDKVIALFRGDDGSVAGFASALLLDVDGHGEVLHLGLTCVRPEHRGGGSTHALLSKIITGYLIRHRLFGRLWISNVACVVSSLGNVAACFLRSAPVAGSYGTPSPQHLAIAAAIEGRYREAIYIRPEARFDADAFVFRGSVRGTMFQKDADDTRYHHRDPELNRFYLERMHFDDGDEVLQVGHASLLALAGYVIRQSLFAKRRRATKPAPAQVMGTVREDLRKAA